MASSWFRNTAPLAALALSFSTSGALARPGTHAPAVSSYDTRASSVVFSYRLGASDAGSFNTLSYNANFSSTTAKLSAQFGLHYVRFGNDESDVTQHGIAGGAVALFEFPVADRFDDGVPRAALGFYVGGVPTGYFSGEQNALTLPLTMGLVFPVSPVAALTLTPSFELAPSANLDTRFIPTQIDVDPNDLVGPDGQIEIDADLVQRIAAQGIETEFSVSVPMRVGLELAIHLGEGADFNVYGGLSTLGGAFRGSLVKTVGAGLVIRWDDIVPAVLPPERRLAREDCGAIEERFRACPNSKAWQPPGANPASPTAPGASPGVAPETPAPEPSVPLTPVAPPPVETPPPAETPADAAPAPEPESLAPLEAESPGTAPTPPTGAFPR